jgi:hypothetical protein
MVVATAYADRRLDNMSYLLFRGAASNSVPPDILFLDEGAPNESFNKSVTGYHNRGSHWHEVESHYDPSDTSSPSYWRQAYEK